MKHVVYLPDQLMVVDDFWPDAEKIRKEALEANDFGPAEHKGIEYPGCGMKVAHPGWKRLEMALGWPILPATYEGEDVTFFRLSKEGDETVTWIHPDTGMDATWAALCYLSEPPEPHYGTAFWSHPAVGHFLPSEARANPEALAELDRIGADQRYWHPAGLVHQKMNRLVVYPTARFHSRWPKEVTGKTKEEGRLIQVWFFDRLEGAEWLLQPPP